MAAPRVLVADGDEDSREVYRMILRHHGYDVVLAEDGARALEMLCGARFDVLILELTLRDTDGYELLEAVRGGAVSAQPCVLVVTARFLTGDRERAEELGCERYLIKPVKPQVLIDEVQAVLAERK